MTVTCGRALLSTGSPTLPPWWRPRRRRSRVVASEQGSVVKGSTVTLYPTSYSGEFLAPAFKKFVAVSNIYKNGVSVGDDTVREFNSKNFLNNVLPGKASTVKLNGLQSGCVYEIVYSAVDYSGKVVANKYYINVQ
jgi:hypothetical protein